MRAPLRKAGDRQYPTHSAISHQIEALFGWESWRSPTLLRTVLK
ncbi:hypothetical protein ACQ4M4_01385 [Leptolyngbya sp. AN02str]